MADVARRAGVSTATVSRALRGLPNVSAEARARVLAAVADLAYVVSPSASRLASGRAGAVGVLVPYPSRWFFGQVLSGAESVFREHSLDLLLYDLGALSARERFFCQLPIRRRVDAVLCIAMPLDHHRQEQLRSLGVPVALVGAKGDGMSSVRIDDVATARTAVRHLADLGHRRIGMIQTEVDEPYFLAMADRRRGYRAELRAQGLAHDRSLEVTVPFGLAGGEHATEALLDLPEPPTAVLAETDELAYGALGALRRRGVGVPAQLSVVGIDDHDMSALLDLTTMRQQVFEQGVVAAQMIVDQLAADREPDEVLLPTELIVRQSTSPPLRIAHRAAASSRR
jgi:DNA-binding LacI/PurR family transcriptional regulator